MSGILVAANWQTALDTNAANFPNTKHIKGDIRALDVKRHPATVFKWDSQECPYWGTSRGEKQTFTKERDPYEDDDGRARHECPVRCLPGLQAGSL